MASISDAPIHTYSQSHKRGLLIICVFLFPLIFSGLLFSLVVLFSDINFKVVGHKTDFANITYPKNRSIVSKQFEMAGSLEKPLNQHSYYLIEYRNKLYWPKFDLGNEALQWKKQLTQRAKQHKYTTYQVVMANQNLKKQLDDWFISAQKSGKYPGILRLPLEHIVASIRVKAP